MTTLTDNIYKDFRLFSGLFAAIGVSVTGLFNGGGKRLRNMGKIDVTLSG